MKIILSLLALVTISTEAANLNVPGLGRDLNGWNGGVASYSKSGAVFSVAKPTQNYDENNNLIITTDVRELKKSSTVFKGLLRVLVSPDGTIRSISMTGEVDGHKFETGEVARQESIAADADASGEIEVAALTPADPQASPSQIMKDDFEARLASAVDRAKESGKTVKKDLSSWLFTSSASIGEVIADGTRITVNALFNNTSR